MSVAEPTTHQRLIDKASGIANEIAHSEVAQTYWQARSKMSRNQEAQALFDDLKKKTNSLLVLQERVGENDEKYQHVKEETSSIEEALAQIPVALQYKAAHEELNGMLQEVVLVLIARLKGEMPVESGPRECSGNCGGSCSSH